MSRALSRLCFLEKPKVFRNSQRTTFLKKPAGSFSFVPFIGSPRFGDRRGPHHVLGSRLVFNRAYFFPVGPRAARIRRPLRQTWWRAATNFRGIAHPASLKVVGLSACIPVVFLRSIALFLSGVNHAPLFRGRIKYGHFSRPIWARSRTSRRLTQLVCEGATFIAILLGTTNLRRGHRRQKERRRYHFTRGISRLMMIVFSLLWLGREGTDHSAQPGKPGARYQKRCTRKSLSRRSGLLNFPPARRPAGVGLCCAIGDQLVLAGPEPFF